MIMHLRSGVSDT